MYISSPSNHAFFFQTFFSFSFIGYGVLGQGVVKRALFPYAWLGITAGKLFKMSQLTDGGNWPDNVVPGEVCSFHSKLGLFWNAKLCCFHILARPLTGWVLFFEDQRYRVCKVSKKGNSGGRSLKLVSARQFSTERRGIMLVGFKQLTTTWNANLNTLSPCAWLAWIRSDAFTAGQTTFPCTCSSCQITMCYLYHPEELRPSWGWRRRWLQENSLKR